MAEAEPAWMRVLACPDKQYPVCRRRRCKHVKPPNKAMSACLGMELPDICHYHVASIPKKHEAACSRRELQERVRGHPRAAAETQGDEAIARARQELSRYPDDVNILGLLGAALGDQKRFQEAEEILLRVIDLTPTFAKPYEDLGTLLLQQGHAQKALPLLEKAVTP